VRSPWSKISDNTNGKLKIWFWLFFIKAAGDFNKGIVGDSERMLNHIAERAHLIPWETCFLLVDEIDSLAPDRTGDTG